MNHRERSSRCALLLLLLVLSSRTGCSQILVTENVTAIAGRHAELSCRVDGADGSPLQWANADQQTLYFDNKKALRDNRFSLLRHGRAELAIELANVSLSDEGVYICSLFSRPVRTDTATLTVLVAPQPPTLLGDYTELREGDTLAMSCSADQGKPAPSLRWFLRDRELKAGHETPSEGNGRSYRVSKPTVMETDERMFQASVDLELEVSWLDDGGALVCGVDHPALDKMSLEAQRILHVQYPPHVFVSASSSRPREGQRLELKCGVQSNPQPSSIHWFRQGANLPENAVISDRHLFFVSLNETDNGTYTCVAENSLGQAQSDYILVVYDEMELAERLGSDQAVVGGVIAVVIFITLCLLILLTHYFGRQKGTYLTNEAKGAEDATDADTAILNAEGGRGTQEEKKEYFL
uniref:cell adhesion molecule 2-like n=1 Tax=Myxine glutinosa TaxID=7769 RepID=UPI00358E0884